MKRTADTNLPGQIGNWKPPRPPRNNAPLWERSPHPARHATLYDLAARIEQRDAVVTVIGLGYVGLPLAVESAHAGFRTYGYDVSEAKVAQVRGGRSTTLDADDAVVGKLVGAGTLSATTDTGVLAQSDVIIICVPTPLKDSKIPDMSYITAAAHAVAQNRKEGQLVILESTSYPGTTDGLLLDILEDAGAQLDTDTFVAFSPERVDPGNPTFKTKDITKVVGGVTEKSTELAVSFYRQFLDSVFPTTSARVAETSKLLENTFRAVNIAMINEFAQICHELDIDVWEVVDAAKTKPFGFMPFYPGPGVGGHCIPLDPHYLAWSARLTGFEPRFIQIADQVNSAMPRYVVDRLIKRLSESGKALGESNILVFGVAYKSNIDDARESPALEVMHLLEKWGANVRYVDPFVPDVSFKGHSWTASELNAETLAWADAGLVLTAHDGFAWDEILERLGGFLLDTRRAVGEPHAKVVRL